MSSQQEGKNRKVVMMVVAFSLKSEVDPWHVEN